MESKNNFLENNIKGHADNITGNYVNGWAISEQANVCKVIVTGEDGSEIGSGITGRTREDINKLFGKKNSGFRVLVRDFGLNNFINIKVNNQDLGNSPMAVNPDIYDGKIEIQGCTASGWVISRGKRSFPPLITLHNDKGLIVGSIDSYYNDDDDKYSGRAYFSIEIDDSMFGIEEFFIDAKADGQFFGRAKGSLKLTGYLDILDINSCSGWLICKDAPHRQLDLEVFHEQTIIGHGKCTVPRPDLKEHFPEGWHNGFSIILSKKNISQKEHNLYSIRTKNGNIELFDGPLLVGHRSTFLSIVRGLANRVHGSAISELNSLSYAERTVMQDIFRLYLSNQRHGPYFSFIPALATGENKYCRPIDIIVPIYKGVEITETCINSTLKVIRPKDRIILVADCPPEREMLTMLESFADLSNIFIIHNKENLGFVGSVNRGLDYCRYGDVLLLNSDTRFYDNGLEEMRRILHNSSDIGTVTALSNSATIFSYPHPNLPSENLEDIGWEDIARIAMIEGKGQSIDVPTGHGFCMLIRREVLDRIGNLNETFGKGYGEENELCLRATDLGFRHVASLGVFVEHRESVSFGAGKKQLIHENLPKLERLYPEYTSMIMDFEANDPLRFARWPLDAFRFNAARNAGTRFVLIIGHYLGGGTDRAENDISNIVGYDGRVKVFLKSTYSGIIELRCDNPIIYSTFHEGDGDSLVDILEKAGIDLSIIHSFIGFGSDIINNLTSWLKDRNSIAYIHDFYPICPRITLINAVNSYCSVQKTDICERCISIDGSHEASKLTSLTVSEHRDLFGKMLQNVSAIIAPSQDTVHHIKKVWPNLPIHIVPHPEKPVDLTFENRTIVPGAIVLVGALGPHKGSEKLMELARLAELTHPTLKFHVLGYTNIDEKLNLMPNVHISGKYSPKDLQNLIFKTGAGFALFLHTWPETYSYTLSEVVELGLMPIVPDIGAPAERVRATGWGEIFPFPIAACDLLVILDEITKKNPPEYQECSYENSSTKMINSVKKIRNFFGYKEL